MRCGDMRSKSSNLRSQISEESEISDLKFQIFALLKHSLLLNL